MAAAPQPTAQPVCTRPTARPRYLSRTTSPISTAPAAHSPPNPKPWSARKANNISKLIAKAHRKVKNEYQRMVIWSIFTRPNLSARVPENHPPRDEISSVTVPIRPASPRDNPHSEIHRRDHKAVHLDVERIEGPAAEAAHIVFRSLAFSSRSHPTVRSLPNVFGERS